LQALDLFFMFLVPLVQQHFKQSEVEQLMLLLLVVVAVVALRLLLAAAEVEVDLLYM
jgi:hypothetical protein